MKVMMVGLLAETPIHPGTGRSMGVIDLPVAREAVTDYPVLVGSSLKGALRDKTETWSIPRVAESFGSADQAGELLVSDGRLLLLPVRSLTGSYRWVTCPYLLERYARDLLRAKLGPRPDAVVVGPREVLARGGRGELVLEERQFTIGGEVPAGIVEAAVPLVLHRETKDRLESQVAVLNDDDFAWFARYGLPIQARNVLDDATKKSENLWYEESLPPDSVMYALVAGRNEHSLSLLDALFPEGDPYLQAGGNETVGHGWFAVSLRHPQDGGAS